MSKNSGDPGAASAAADEQDIALERYRLLVEYTRDIVLMFDGHGRIAEVNRAAIDTYGYSREELLSMNLGDLRASETQAKLGQQFDTALHGRIMFETTHVKKDGTLIDVEVQSTSAPHGAGRLVMSVIRDITERRRAERDRTFMSKLTSALAELDSPDMIMQTAGRMILDQFEVDQCAFVEIDENVETANILHAAARDQPLLSGEYLTKDLRADDELDILRSGRSLVINDTASEVGGLAATTQRWRDLGLRSVLTTPYLSGGWKFALGLYGKAPREWTPDQVTIARELAERIYLRLERTAADLTRRASENKFQAFMANSPMAAWIVDKSGVIRYLNPAYYDSFAIRKSFTSGHVSELYPAELAREYLANNQIVFDEDRPLHTMEQGTRADGTLGEFIVVKFPLLMENGERLVAGLAYDITERKLSEERYYSLFRSMQEGLIVAELIEDEDGGGVDFRYLDMNPAAERILGMSRENVVGKRAQEIIPEDGRETFDVYANVVRTGEALRHEIYNGMLDQHHENFAFRPAPGQLAVLFWDITERKRSEDQLRLYSETLEQRVAERTQELARTNKELTVENRQRRKLEKERVKLLSELVRSQENERRRIAHDLHDHIGQQMTAIDLNIQLLLDVFGQREAFDKQVSELRSITRRVGREVDSLAWELRPATLDDHGFVPALHRYIQDWTARFEVPVDFWADSFVEKECRLSPEAETNLYRIVQEALNNVAKYAQATRVDVLLDAREDHVRLIIEDNGEGFEIKDFQAVRNNRPTMGLIGMRERCAIIGGSFMIESNPGEGTSVFVQAPLADKPVK